MSPRARTLAAAVAAAAAGLASAGCPSLDALECHGAGCEDGSAAGDGAAAEGAGGDGSAAESGSPQAQILCGGGAWCTPPHDECCLDQSGSTACTSINGCSGSDIFCDDPSQCPGGGTCWICVNSQGFQGTSCDFDGDIVANDHCDLTNALALCHSSTQCEGGTTCQPFAVTGFDAGAGASWFRACQP
jgi:hypothetical protein